MDAVREWLQQNAEGMEEPGNDFEAVLPMRQEECGQEADGLPGLCAKEPEDENFLYALRVDAITHIVAMAVKMGSIGDEGIVP